MKNKIKNWLSHIISALEIGMLAVFAVSTLAPVSVLAERGGAGPKLPVFAENAAAIGLSMSDNARGQAGENQSTAVLTLNEPLPATTSQDDGNKNKLMPCQAQSDKDENGGDKNEPCLIKPPPKVKPLSLSDFSVKVNSHNSAHVTWQTNIKADSRLWFATSSPINTASTSPNVTKKGEIKNHNIVLNNLEASTTYFLMAESADKKGETVFSSEISFTTPPNPNPPPQPEPVLTLSDVTVQTEINSAVVSWNTNEPADSAVWFGTTTPVDTANAPSVKYNSDVYNHYVALNGLEAGTTYYLVVGSSDGNGLSARSSESSFETAAAPVVNPPLSLNDIFASIGTSTVQFNWQTSAAADSELYYSTSSPVTIGGAGVSSLVNGSLSLNHSLTASGLLSNTIYYFVLHSIDVNGNAATSSQFGLNTEM